MTIDWQQIANILITVGFGAVGWFYAQIQRDHDQTRQWIYDIRIELPTKYVSKDDLTNHLNRIEATVNGNFFLMM